jgi:hypothetical protein
VKRIVRMLFALVVVITTTSTVYAQCSNATLSGNYAFTDAGFGTLRHSGPQVPIDAVGTLNFDGAGNVSFPTLTLAFDGSISTETGSGSYTVNSDCTGSISITGGSIAGITFNIVIVGGGAEVFGIVTSPANTQTFDAKKQ